MKKLKPFLFKLLFFFTFPSFHCLGYQLLPPSDTSYFKQKVTDKLELFFSEDYKKHSLLLYQYTQFLNKEIGQVFPLSPYYRKNSIVFVSPKKQISNAITFIYPSPSIFIYSSPAQIMDFSALFNWSLDSLAHEITHLYQINSQTKTSHWLSYFFHPISWFVYPNIYSHDLILEGNAVLHESIYGSGGRLFSGWARSIVFAQIKSNISLRRLLNKYNDSFSHLEKYLHGGYFYSYLLSNYNLKKLNKFFYFHSKNILLPPLGTYKINSSFKKSLNTSFYSALENYKNYYKPQALKQKVSKGKILITSNSFLPLNSDDKNIFFLVTNLKSPPSLVILNKKTQTISLTKKDMPLGKVFLIDGTYYSASTGQTSTTEEKFTLFESGHKPLKKYISQYVMDLSKNKELSLDTKQSLDQMRLLVNNKFYGKTHSSAVLDQKGNIYYFKNKNEKRTLYKNKTPLWSYKGYYGFPVEAHQEGVYFIAATKYGSSLFLHSKGSTFRLSKSDTIISARKINKTDFLVSEVTSKNYEYKIIKIIRKKEEPYLYKYAFTKKKINTKQMESKNYSPKPYHYLTNWKLQNVLFIPSLSSSRQLNIDTFFPIIDSLNYNKLSIRGSINKRTHLLSLDYFNQKYRLAFQITPAYQKGILSLKSNEDTIDTFRYLKLLKEKDIYQKLHSNEYLDISLKRRAIPYQNRAIDFNLDYLIYRTNRLNISFLKRITLGQRQFNANKKWINYRNYFGNLELTYYKKYLLAFSEYQKISLKALYDIMYIQIDESNYKTYLTGGVNFLFSQNLGKETYISTSGSIRRNLWNRKPKQIFKTKTKNAIFYFHTFKQTVQNFNQINFNIKKALNQSLHPIYFPLALNRWAPFTGVSLVSFEDKELYKRGYHYLLNTYLGGDFEFIANYKGNFNLGFALGYIWKWKNKFGENKKQLHSEVYLKVQL